MSGYGRGRNLIRQVREIQRFARRSEAVRNHQLMPLIQQGHEKSLECQVQKLLARDQRRLNQARGLLKVRGLNGGDPLI